MTDFENKQIADSETMENVMNSVQKVNAGGIVKGEVSAIGDKQIVVGIEGASTEGVVPTKELSTLPVEDVYELVEVGSVLDLVVITSIGKGKENGSHLLSKRHLDAKKVWEEVEQDSQTGKVIGVPVTDVVKGGLVTDVGVHGFVPASMAEGHFVADFSEHKGQTLAFKIIEIEPSENRLVLSRKAVVETGKEPKKEELLSFLHDGGAVEGRVARLTDFGAFIDLGGVDGLVHVSEIAHQYVGKPSDALIVGGDARVEIFSTNPEKGRISLSIKKTLPGPWADIKTKATAGTVLDGTVKRLTSFGASVEVFPGVERLVHISQISHKYITTSHEVFYEGNQVQVKVLEVNPEKHRTALSIKTLEPKLESQEEPKKEQKYELPEENTGFTMGDILGDALSDAKEEE